MCMADGKVCPGLCADEPTKDQVWRCEWTDTSSGTGCDDPGTWQVPSNASSLSQTSPSCLIQTTFGPKVSRKPLLFKDPALRMNAFEAVVQAFSAQAIVPWSWFESDSHSLRDLGE